MEWLSPKWAKGDTLTRTIDSIPEQLELTVGYPNTSNCSGTFITKTCTLTEAVIDYPATLVNSTVTLDLTRDPRVITLGNPFADISLGYDPGANLTLGGFALAGADLFGSNTSLRLVGAAGVFQIEGMNTFTSQYIVNASYVGNCQFTFNDPTRDILTALHEIMFRTALNSSNVEKSVIIQNKQGNYTFYAQQPVAASRTFLQNVFQSHFGYLSGAIALITLGILSVLPTYSGW